MLFNLRKKLNNFKIKLNSLKKNKLYYLKNIKVKKVQKIKKIKKVQIKLLNQAKLLKIKKKSH
jgi:hypothetical protein